VPTFLKEALKAKKRRTKRLRKYLGVGEQERLWIKKAIAKPGALRRTVMQKYGKAGFTERGTIKTEVLKEMAKDGLMGKRARLALTLRGLRKR